MPTTRRARSASAAAPLLLVLALLLGPPAAAQLAPQLALSLQPGRIELRPGGAQDVQVSVANQGPLDAGVQLALQGLPADWSAALVPPALQVPAGQTASAVLRVTAGQAATAASLTVAGTLRDAAGRTAEARAPLQVALVLPPAVPTPAPDTSWMYMAAALAVAALSVLGLVARERGVRVALAAEDKPARPGTYAYVQVAVTNGSRRERRVDLAVEG
ncbi:MAG: hypothetical protein LC624_01815, partial [Halobacteriales archaeon]|nr:hypothetical protein [Halobacteriales archaeon]